MFISGSLWQGPEIMSEGDLIEIGMSHDEERTQLIRASQQLINNTNIGRSLFI